ncbi:MAG: pgsA [Gammaproteobacteria bacterium]|jgi:CDP-diacylglycerol--glycerol-3-phosphate 3-phosphatidyltransferase|nr:pgsA [Gammaproteobacteria bacterium]
MNNLPNFLTFVRIAIIPFLVFVFYLPLPWAHTAASFIFALAALTDWLDGYLARSLKQSTKLGAFLDPVADKLMVSVALVLIVGEPQFQFVSLPSAVYSVPIPIITIPVAIIVSREIVVSSLREWMAEMGKRATVAVSQLGKIKTSAQMIAVVILLYCTPRSHAFIAITGYMLLYLAAILTIWSMSIYLKVAWLELKDEEA